MVLVNPNNPTGQFLPKPEVLTLAEELRKRDVTLIVDESFVDFVDGRPEHSLLGSQAGELGDNTIVVRSLGKSHGVAGLRLGVLLSHDRDLLARIQAHLPIWNINAVAEYFLQLAPRYQTAYRQACQQVAAERGRLFDALAETPILRPLESSANFILCEVTAGIAPEHLVAWLLDQRGILLKECSAKRGLDGRPFVRLAVRDRVDNDKLLAAVASFQTTSLTKLATARGRA